MEDAHTQPVRVTPASEVDSTTLTLPLVPNPRALSFHLASGAIPLPNGQWVDKATYQELRGSKLDDIFGASLTQHNLDDAERKRKAKDTLTPENAATQAG